MTVQIGQVYRHPRYIRRVEIVSAGPRACTFKFVSFPEAEDTMRIADMQHWALVLDICALCGDPYAPSEARTVPDPDTGNPIEVCQACYGDGPADPGDGIPPREM